MRFNPRVSSQIRNQRRMERELRLRDHIHGLLFDYCRTHITNDYLTFTQDAVQSVSPISPRSCLPPDQSFLMPPRIVAAIRQDRTRIFGGFEFGHHTCRPDRHSTSGLGRSAHPGREMEGGNRGPLPCTEIHEPRHYFTIDFTLLA